MYMSRRNVTITLDEETARWARLEAARRDTSVSRLVGELLRDHMRRERNYDEAMERYLEAAPRQLKREGGYPPREEVHRRGG
jgi:ribosome biogenesis SPOUT family RNA methylase Rps3